jgi:hypothetical protein
MGKKMAKVEFYHKYNDEYTPDEFRIKIGDVDRLATKEDKKAYREEYNAEKMKRAKEEPRPPKAWEREDGGASLVLKDKDGNPK